MHRNNLLKFECMISQGGNVLPKLGMSHYSRFLSILSSFSVVSKASLRRLPLVKKFALKNVVSIIKFDNI